MYKFFDNKKQKFRFVVLKTLVEGTEWYRRQLKFVREHRYFTTAARSLRDEGKRKNIEALVMLLNTRD